MALTVFREAAAKIIEATAARVGAATKRLA